jgi:hypothetical protein
MSSGRSPSRGEYRGFYVALPDDPDFQTLSGVARAVFYPLKLKLGLAGIAVFYPEMLPALTGFSLEETTAALEELRAAEWIRSERNVYWVRNGLRFDPAQPLRSPNQRKAIDDYLATLPRVQIVNDFAAYYGLDLPFPAPPSSRNGNPSERVPEGFGDHSEALKTETDTDTDSLLAAGAHTREVDQDQDHNDGVPPPSPEVPSSELVRKIIAAANAGMRANEHIDQQTLRPLLANHGPSVQVVADWQVAGIPLERILEVIEARCAAFGPTEGSPQINSLKYFDKPVREAHEKATTGGNHGAGSGGGKQRRRGRAALAAAAAPAGPGAERGQVWDDDD